MTITVPAAPPSNAPGGASTRSVSPPFEWRRVVLKIVFTAFVLVGVYAIYDIGVNPLTLFFERDDIGNLLERMWAPRVENPGSVLKKVLDTFLMAVVGTALAFVLAVPFAFVAARNIVKNPLLRGLSRAVIVLTRAVPELVLALVFVRVFGIGVLPGVVALGIHSVGMLAKLFADSIEQIDQGQRDGVAATGAGRLQESFAGVLPQIMPSFIGITLYRLDINFRVATILGLVGAGGIGLDIRAHQGSLDYQQLLGVTLVIMAFILVVEVVSTQVRSIILGHDNAGRPGLLNTLFSLRTPDIADFEPVAPSADETLRNNPTLRPPWTKQRIAMSGFGASMVALVVLAFTVTDMSVREFFVSLPDVPEIFYRLVPKNMDWWQSQFFDEFVETVFMGFAATLLALIFAIPTALLAARNVAPARWVYATARIFILGVRALPDLVVAVIFVAALGLGPKPGVLALAIGLYGFATKLFADSIEEISESPRDGIRATGAGPFQEASSGVMTQAMPAIVGNSLYLLDVSIRSSTVLGIVGAGGIGFTLFQASKLLKWELIGGLLLITFVIVYSIELLSTWARKQLL